jgi:hypothetical protein
MPKQLIRQLAFTTAVKATAGSGAASAWAVDLQVKAQAGATAVFQSVIGNSRREC